MLNMELSVVVLCFHSTYRRTGKRKKRDDCMTLKKMTVLRINSEFVSLHRFLLLHRERFSKLVLLVILLFFSFVPRGCTTPSRFDSLFSAVRDLSVPQIDVPPPLDPRPVKVNKVADRQPGKLEIINNLRLHDLV
jgi:hypothetical protein